MTLSTTWLSQSAKLKTTFSALALCALSNTAMADVIDKSAVQFIGPLGEDMQLKPYQRIIAMPLLLTYYLACKKAPIAYAFLVMSLTGNHSTK